MTEDAPVIAVDDDFDVIMDGPDRPVGVDLFNTRSFHELHCDAALSGHYFALSHRSTGRAVSVVHLLESAKGHWESPFRGSFGAFQAVAGVQPSVGVMARFISAVDEALANRGATRVTMVLPPMAYRMDECSTWANLMMRAGYSVSRHELSYSIDVRDGFEERLDRGNRKQLRKGERHGLQASQLERGEFAAAYDVIAANRAKKGRTPSRSWAALDGMIARFPAQVLCFGVRHRAALVASAICLLVNPTTLYVFYWGEVADVETLSPVTFLARHIHAFCAASGITLMDLGTATVHGEPDPGLIRYKRHLGCHASLKLTLSRGL